MKKILLSIAVLGAVSALAIGATTAIFSDDEVSSGNTFTAGAIDLKIDNESYYNGLLNASTTWLQLADLDDGNGPSGEGQYLFFDFRDLKPGDYGEDTISLHVLDNDSWLCVDVTLTSNEDNSSTEPELIDENPYTDGPGEGELADAVHFIWWADDGDNVLETDEELLPAGPLGNLEVGETASVALSDSQNNIWGTPGEPFPGDEVRYIGKAWCFGEMNVNPVAPGDNDPTIDPGFSCNGAPVNNVTQTDSMTADIVFHVEQSRNNAGFLCEPLPETTGTLQIVKEVNGEADPDSFTFDVDGGAVLDDVTQGAYVLESGSYTVTENPFGGYTTDLSACGTDGAVEIVSGEVTICTVTNTQDAATLTVDKVIQFSDAQVDVDVNDFDLFIDDGDGPVQVTDEVANLGLAPGTYTVSETYTGSLNIDIDAQYSGACTDEGETGSVTLAADDDVTCVITNEITPIPDL